LTGGGDFTFGLLGEKSHNGRVKFWALGTVEWEKPMND
jgi:hypothetical protein